MWTRTDDTILTNHSYLCHKLYNIRASPSWRRSVTLKWQQNKNIQTCMFTWHYTALKTPATEKDVKKHKTKTDTLNIIFFFPSTVTVSRLNVVLVLQTLSTGNLNIYRRQKTPTMTQTRFIVGRRCIFFFFRQENGVNLSPTWSYMAIINYNLNTQHR